MMSSRKVTIRPANFPDDLAGIMAIERSYNTDYVLQLETDRLSLALHPIPIAPLHKDFPLDDEEATCRPALVAVIAARIVGFAAYSDSLWNRRTQIEHLYVAADSRGQGIGRRLVHAIEQHAHNVGTRCLWLETSNHAWPAIQFYQRIGFTLCGMDASLYDPAGPAGAEVALYFTRPLDPTWSQ